MNFEQARLNMIEQQIRTWEVLDQRVLDLIERIHREDFVPEEFRRLALADIQIPLDHGQYALTPKMEARILQTLDLRSDDKVLEVGTGCAYLTALLAAMAGQVISVDLHPDFTRQAAAKLARHGLHHVTLETGDAAHGWSKDAPYDAIVVTGSVPMLESCWQEQLKINGRLFITVGTAPVMEAMLLTRSGEQEWTRETLFETDIPPLAGVRPVAQFRF